MTRVDVSPVGACGMKAVIRVDANGGRKYLVSIETDCPHVGAMAGDIRELARMDALAGFHQNPVYRAAARHLSHVSCPVPCAVLKCLEVEAGLSVKKDVKIEFAREVS